MVRPGMRMSKVGRRMNPVANASFSPSLPAFHVFFLSLFLSFLKPTRKMREMFSLPSCLFPRSLRNKDTNNT